MISLLCPTRKRPANLARLVASILATASTHLPIEVICYVDEDDHETIAEKNILRGVIYHVGPRLCLSDYWNKLVPLARHDILMLAADDMVFRSPGWDVLIEKAFADCPDKILMVHGDDQGPNGKNFATLPIVSRRWVEVVGYFTPPGFPGDYADTWIDEVAGLIGRKKFLPFIVEHMHWLWNKAPHDQVYIEREQKQRQHNSTLVYTQRAQERLNDAARLKQAIESFAAKKSERLDRAWEDLGNELRRMGEEECGQ